MPILRKVPAAEAAAWAEEDLELAPFALEALLVQIAGADRSGLTRIDIGNEHAWRARVYRHNREYYRNFADSIYGGPAAALRQAVAWRDSKRQELGPPARHQSGRTWRIVRVDRPEHKNVGYFVYADRRRYFSDAAYGGSGGAKAAAEAWLAGQRNAAQNTIGGAAGKQ
jgi:hypothetical protein